MIDNCQRRSRRSAAWRTSKGTGWHLRAGRDIPGTSSGDLSDRGYRLQGHIEYFVNAHYRVEAHLLSNLLGDVVEIATVSLRQDHVREPRRMGGKHLLLESADRQHAALQRDLAGHPHRVLDRPL